MKIIAILKVVDAGRPVNEIWPVDARLAPRRINKVDGQVRWLRGLGCEETEGIET